LNREGLRWPSDWPQIASARNYYMTVALRAEGDGATAPLRGRGSGITPLTGARWKLEFMRLESSRQHAVIRQAMPRGKGALLAAVLLVAVALLSTAAPAMGHAFLVQTTPRASERLSSAPPAVELRFSEAVVGARLTVSAADGTPVRHADARRSNGGLVVEALLPDLEAGIYVVAYDVVADDAHVTAGEFAFAVGDVDEDTLASRESRRAGEELSWPQAVARWLLVAGLLLAVGGLASEAFVWRPLAPPGVSLPRLPLAGLLATAALGAAISLAAILAGSQPDAVEGGGLQRRLLAPPVLALAAQLLLVAVGGQLLMVSGLRQWALLPLGLALGIAALTGHPAVEGMVPAALNVVHIGAVALWSGALLHVALVVWRFRQVTDLIWMRRAVVRYATLALIVAGLAIVTGVGLAVIQFDEPSELLSTTYGRLLIAKLVLVATALSLALLARVRGLGRRRLRVGLLSRITRLEALALIGTLALASIVASATPPSAVRGASYLLGPPPLDGPVLRLADLAGSMAVHVAAAPGRLEVRALGFSGEGITDAELRLSGERPGGVGLDLQPRDCGPGCWTTAVTWPTGTTVLRADLSAPDWPSGNLEFELPWPPEPEGQQQLEAVLEAMRAEREVVMTEQTTSGPGMTGEAHTFRQSGEEFARRELYAAGGATDIHPLPPRSGAAALTLYLPGSSIWFRLELDERDRIVAETIVSPGHLIERTFSYPGE
jgi:copper transport protein